MKALVEQEKKNYRSDVIISQFKRACQKQAEDQHPGSGQAGLQCLQYLHLQDG
eukprot:m.199421 g.199421  ORF g.199421 m.199421 type:complete len:53 (+) comp16845_c1_seq1:2219-2377(+)